MEKWSGSIILIDLGCTTEIVAINVIVKAAMEVSQDFFRVVEQSRKLWFRKRSLWLKMVD